MDVLRGALVALGTSAALVGLGAVAERARGGIELLFIAFALALAGPAFGRWLAARGRANGPRGWVFALELAAWSGIAVYPVGRWAHVLAALAALAVAFGRPRGEGDPPPPRASALEEGLVLALGLVALAATLRPLLFEPKQAFPWAVLVLAVLAIEAFGPLAPRTVDAASRRAAGFALAGAAAIVHGQEDGIPGLAAEDVLLVAAGAAAALRARDVATRARGVAEAPPRARKAVQALFAFSLGAAVLVLAFYPGVVHEERVDLAPSARRHLEGRCFRAELPRLGLAHPTCDRAVLLEDGVPLPLPRSEQRAIAALGGGRYDFMDGHLVLWSSSDGTSPLENGRRYEVLEETGYLDVLRTWPGELLLAAALLLGSLAWCTGGVRTSGRSPLALRLLLVLVLAGSLGVGLSRQWRRVAMNPDTPTYVFPNPQRTVLYPAFIGLLGPAAPADRGSIELGSFDGPEHPYLPVVRAQKALTVLSLVVLVWVLSGTINVWLLAPLVYAGLLADVPFDYDSVSSSMNAILSEGLNQPLVFLFMAGLFAYLRSPGPLLGGALGLVLSLLVLVRPQNGVLLAALGALWLFHRRQDGWRAASARLALVAAVVAVPLLAACARNHREHGRFKLHASGGTTLLGNALALATDDDVLAFDEPELRELVRLCIADERRGIDPTDPNYMNANLWVVASAAYEKVFPGAGSAFDQDDVFSKIAQRLLARHKLGLARIVLYQLRSLGRTTMILAILGAGVALVLYRRTGRRLLLFAFLFCGAPFVAIAPACVLTVPIGRYFMPFYFAEALALPFLAAVLLTPETPPAERPRG